MYPAPSCTSQVFPVSFLHPILLTKIRFRVENNFGIRLAIIPTTFQGWLNRFLGFSKSSPPHRTKASSRPAFAPLRKMATRVFSKL